MRTKFYAENFLGGPGQFCPPPHPTSSSKYVGFYSAIPIKQKSRTISWTEMLFCCKITFLLAFAFWRLHSEPKTYLKEN